jgi:hypothetical protein
VQNVLTKLGVRSRLQAAALVAKEGLAAELGDPIPAPRHHPAAAGMPHLPGRGLSALHSSMGEGHLWQELDSASSAL